MCYVCGKGVYVFKEMYMSPCVSCVSEYSRMHVWVWGRVRRQPWILALDMRLSDSEGLLEL